jgi:predicted PurR-regulated permease PerM
MTEQSNSQQGIRFLVIAAALVIILMGINQAQSVLVSFLVAIFFAIIGTPPVLWLQRKRIPSIVAVLLVVSGMITILLLHTRQCD